MHDIYYENGMGERLNLLEYPYCMQTADLFDYEWGYETRFSGSNSYGIKNFSQGTRTKEVRITIAGCTEQDFYSNVDRFFDVANYDVLNGQCGRLWFGEYYLKCYIIGAKKEGWEEDCGFADEVLTIVTDYPFWVREKEMNFTIKESMDEDKHTIDYPHDFAYDYTASLTSDEIMNETNSLLEFEFKIFGPCNSPRIIIGRHAYKVDAVLEDGEYLVINSVTRKIYKVKIDGEMVNQYSLKNEDSYIFQKIPAGTSIVSWDNAFGFSVSLIERRITPRWI